MSTVRLLGVRHHGPGSARAVLRALGALEPTAVLVELPADCVPLLSWVGHESLVPPVALLGHVADRPGSAAFLPFAEFSPEWQAFRWAAERGTEVRGIDLPLANALAEREADELFAPSAEHPDPLAELAAAAGDTDPERWWDAVVEHAGAADDPFAVFDALGEAMAAARSGTVPSASEVRREAHMRTVLRSAVSDGHQRIAVVCGAWHVPALVDLSGVGADRSALKGIPRTKVAISWVPWTHRRLASSAGYGAGVRSPGWYAHRFREPGPQGVSTWFVHAARLLRSRGVHTSPDHLIAATRAADALAALRGRPAAGLEEVLDAAGAVMADSAGVALIARELVVGPAIGEVPADAPAVPLARDLSAQQRSTRLKPEADGRLLELDLRTPQGRNRSVLLHRTLALGIPWATLREGRGSSGSFRETWWLEWEPEASVRVVELSSLGTTVRSAAAARLHEAALQASLADVVTALELALLADLDEVVQSLASAVSRRAAADPDLAQVVDTLGPLSRALRYGDARGTPAHAIRAVFDGLVVRVVSGLVLACRSLSSEQASAMVDRIADAQAAIGLVDHPARRGEWPAVLVLLAERSDVHPLVQGRATRLLHDSGTWNNAAVGARLGRGLSPAVLPAAAASFVEGFLAGSGTVLVHDSALLGVLDEWLSSLSVDAFMAVVAVLRRTFGAFEPAERRQLGLLLADEVPGSPWRFGTDLDPQRAAAAMTTVRQLLGVA